MDESVKIMHVSSFKLIREFFRKYIKLHDKVLEVGSKIVEEQANNPRSRELIVNAVEYVGMDIEPGLNVDLVVKDPYVWREIPDNTFNIILSSQVFEHVEFFWLVFEEMVRVLKPKGYICIVAPTVSKIHEFPVDCWRFLPDGMKALAHYTKIDVICADCGRPTYSLIDGKGINDCIGIFRKP